MSPERRRDQDSGRYGSEYSSNQYLEAVRRLEPTTTGEVAEELECHRNTARRNLEKLAERGELEQSKRSGAFLWQTI
ncbi:helix-turn-helix domain-containing protein [Natronorubrum daqingense]|uniref:Transcriptional regulator n=1 Tax=Natronorubrum daqingense TaxID=588898 RepID=A0A1N7G4V5_9EURY|nr:transcriptional regulator [Natronorubrum daqingense]SIS07534.1 hypothetical protein SAMN05421809_3719 [Natronorubrum daqingense]